MGNNPSPHMEVKYLNSQYVGIGCDEDRSVEVIELAEGQCFCRRPMSHDLEKLCTDNGHGAWSKGEHRGLGIDRTDLFWLQLWMHPAHGVENWLTIEKTDRSAYRVNLNE